jgi:hypothetical protein
MEGVMATDTATGGVWLLRAALLVTTALILSIGSPASARVGVTSGADGDPLGKPPNENERILRIGIDVQANELITTAANDRAHLVFLDGSALTVGPNARLAIDRFVYDPNTQRGELAINATKGVFRLVGGKISKNTPITITTPSSTIGIRGGITIFSVTQVQTIANFVFGSSMTVTAGGLTQTATRAGSQVVTNAGGTPGAASLFKSGSLTADLSQLEGGSSNNNNSADQSAQNSGFSNKNSGQPPANTPNPNQNGPPNTTNNTLTNTVSNTNPAGQPLGNSTLVDPKTPTASTVPPNNPPNPNTTQNPPPPTANNNPSPPPAGPTRTTQTLTGYVGGLVVITQSGGGDSPSSSTRVRLLGQPGSVSIATDATNNTATGTIVVGLNGSHHHPATATLQLGGAGSSTFTDDKNYSMTSNPSRPSTVKIGDTTYTVDAANTLASASTSSACTCEFLSFGAWTTTSVADPRNNGKTYTAYGTYVAGTPTTAVQLPQTGGAIYSGFMAGFASNNGTAPPPGSYQNVWNFASRTGTVTANFDGAAFNGNTAMIGNSARFNTPAAITGTGGRNLTLDGAFFTSPSDPAKYQAGSFAVKGSNYTAGGVFAGQR